jgi:hypothetical protein
VILVPAAVILAGLGAKVRIDQWENAVDACYAQLKNDRVAFRLADAHSAPVPLAGGPQVVIGWQDARNRETQTYRRLLRLLENKPFGIPLDQEEQSVLDSMRIELSRRDPASEAGLKGSPERCERGRYPSVNVSRSGN